MVFHRHYKYICLSDVKTISSGDTVSQLTVLCVFAADSKDHWILFSRETSTVSLSGRRVWRTRRDWAREYPVYHNTPLLSERLPFLWISNGKQLLCFCSKSIYLAFISMFLLGSNVFALLKFYFSSFYAK